MCSLIPYFISSSFLFLLVVLPNTAHFQVSQGMRQNKASEQQTEKKILPFSLKENNDETNEPGMKFKKRDERGMRIKKKRENKLEQEEVDSIFEEEEAGKERLKRSRGGH